MKVMVLAEGSSQEQRQRREWGISMLVNDNILFDTFGHPELFEKNIRKYGVNVPKIKNIVISHIHWDHISGLEFVLKSTYNPSVFIPQENSDIVSMCKKYGAEIFVLKKRHC